MSQLAHKIIAQVSAQYSLPAGELAKVLANRGWDFSPLKDEDAGFVTKMAEHYAADIANGIAHRAAQAAARVADRKASMTAGARANPDAVCGKCDGKGSVSFRHIANGRCFQCGGKGWMALADRKRSVRAAW